jgi:hypothetical protein
MIVAVDGGIASEPAGSFMRARSVLLSIVVILLLATFAGLGRAAAQSKGAVAPAGAAGARQAAAPTATPIKHLVIIFQENVSFDHYFATYPRAANPPGEPAFTAAPGRRYRARFSAREPRPGRQPPIARE